MVVSIFAVLLTENVYKIYSKHIYPKHYMAARTRIINMRYSAKYL